MENGLPGRTRWLDVAPGRLPGWLESFAHRHGGLTGPPRYLRPDTAETDLGDQAISDSGWAGRGRAGARASVVVFRAADGATAECHVPFPPLPAAPASGAPASHDPANSKAARADAAPAGPASTKSASAASANAGLASCTPASKGLADDEPRASATRMAAHALADRTVGVLLVRLGGYAAGVFMGTDQHLAASKVGSRLVHGRSAAGGQSQRRFARRREKQASEALGAAADTAAAVFGPYTGRLDAVVLGGDKRAMSGLADDPRLRPFLDLAVDRFLTVPDPRLAVLKSTPRMFTAIRIRLTEPASPDDPAAAP
jgi:Actinobacteria/chloroflexi VLRF1 release factor